MRQFLIPCLLLVVVATGSTAQHRAPSDNPPRVVSNSQPAEQESKHSNSVQAQTEYSHGNPTAEEQVCLEYINRARANPKAEGERLANTTDVAVQSAYTYFKIDKNKLKTQFNSYPSRPPVAFHTKLIDAARGHSNDMAKNDFQGHTGSNGSDMVQRITKAGHSGANAWGENVSSYSESMWYGHCGFNVDWGTQNQIDLGHRSNIMNFENIVFNEVGIGVVNETNPSTQVGPWLITHDFARTQTVYILGVVYKDKNNNGFYDIGEGISGVKITPSRGNYFAVSSTSGGYAIPITGTTGSVTLVAQGNGINETKQVSVSTVNVKVDFGQATTPSVILLSPEDASAIDVDSAKLVWSSIKGATKYHLQVSELEDFSTLAYNDSTLKDTTAWMRNLKNLGFYYWRVRAFTTTNGWGELSPSYSFSIAITPKQLALLSPGDAFTKAVLPMKFVWSKGSPNVAQYSFEIARDTIFMDLVHYFAEYKDTSYTFTDPDELIEYNKTYYWHVNAENEAGVSDWTPYRSFSTIFVGVEDSEQPVPVQVFPQPTQSLTYLVFDSQSTAPCTIEVYSQQGIRVATIAQQEFSVGRNSVALDFTSKELSHCASGAYVVRITQGTLIKSATILLQR